MRGSGLGEAIQFSDQTVGEAELADVDLVLAQSVSQSFLHSQVDTAIWRVKLSEYLCDSKIEEGDGGPS